MQVLHFFLMLHINNMAYVNQDSAFWYWKVSRNFFYINLGPF